MITTSKDDNSEANGNQFLAQQARKRQLSEMSSDSEIQREIQAINVEFSITDAEGLEIETLPHILTRIDKNAVSPCYAPRHRD